MKKLQISGPEGMVGVAAEVLTLIGQQATDTAVVVALSGELGAGKTTLMQALAHQLGVAETITSPTYVVMKGYELEAERLPAGLERFSHLIHIDAYRIEDVDEMRVLRFGELLGQKDTIICIEWPEHIQTLIPNEAITVRIEIVGEGRTVSINHAH